MNTADFVPSLDRYAAQKKLKTSHTSLPISQKYISHSQPPSPANPSLVPVNRQSRVLYDFLCRTILFSFINFNLYMYVILL